MRAWLLVLFLAACGDTEADLGPDPADLAVSDLPRVGAGATCFNGLGFVATCAAGLKCCIPNYPHHNNNKNEQLY